MCVCVCVCVSVCLPACLSEKEEMEPQSLNEEQNCNCEIWTPVSTEIAGIS